MRTYPLGEKREVVIDTEIQFGTPTIKGTRINTWVIYGMFKAGDPIKLLMDEYNITEKQVTDAIAYEQILKLEQIMKKEK